MSCVRRLATFDGPTERLNSSRLSIRVAEEIDNHQVFCALLRVIQQGGCLDCIVA